MKLNSLEPSRKIKTKIKIILLLFSLTAGILTAAETRYGVFRLINIEAEPQGVLPQDVILGTISPIQERFWPLLLMHENSYCAFIEKYYPVKLRISISGWGKFKLEVMPLNPIIKMYWGGKFWYVSPNGKVWLTSMKENDYISTAEANSAPILSWSSDRITPVDISGDHGNIYSSTLPMPMILKWYENIMFLGWNERVRFIQVCKREERNVVQLMFHNQENTGGATIMFIDDPEEWHAAGLAVNNLYPDMTKVSHDIFIDTTYKGKILVKYKVK